MRSSLCLIFMCAIACLTGCPSIFNREPLADSKKDVSGHVVLRDTPRMWSDWREEVDDAIAMELSGKAPGGGISSWNDQWQRSISENRSREHSQRYVDYVIQSRRQAGLPELVAHQ